MDTKNKKYNYKEDISFERHRFFRSSYIRGIIISYKFINYNWMYLVECCDDKILVTINENDIWSLQAK